MNALEKPSLPHGHIRIGISGWRYPPWRGAFYPRALRQKDELAFASSNLPTIEINSTFYSLKTPKNYLDWAAQTPKHFVFSVKAPRYITHILRLENVQTPLANFFANGVLGLGSKLGPILWQFPPSFHFDPDLVEAFFKLLPQDTKEASALAKQHDAQVNGRTSFAVSKAHKLRHAMEIRHKSFVTPEFVALLRKYRIALVCADTVEWPRLMDVTSDFLYCRLHGSETLYVSGYTNEALDTWANRVRAWARGSEPEDGERASNNPAPRRAKRDVYVYFDNSIKIHAPFNAKSLIERIAH